MNNTKKLLMLSACLYLTPIHAEETARAVISSLDRTTISTEVAGKILYLPSGEGDSFKKGAVLAKIDCALYKAQQRKIIFQKKIAYQQLKKNEQLNKLKSIGAFEVTISKEEYNKQIAELDIVSVNVKRCQIYAPFDGRVVQKMASQYQIAKVQQELLEIVGTGNIEAKVVVDATWLSWLKKGDELTLAIDETQTQIKATVNEIGAVVDPASQTVLVRANLIEPYENIAPGMSGTAKFNSEN